MPRTRFDRRMNSADRAALNAEIRRRGYGDLKGLCTWLEERGVTISKSMVSLYVIRLRRMDEMQVPASISPETQAALVDFAQLVLNAKAGWERLLETLQLRHETPPT